MSIEPTPLVGAAPMHPRTPLRLMAAAAALAAFLAARVQVRAEDTVVTAISAQAADDYVRVKLADGSYQKETYTFGNGGRMVGSTSDASIDKLTFMGVAKVIAGPLEAQHYVTQEDRDPDLTKLLIMVYWGTTNGTQESTQAFAYESVQGVQTGEAGNPPPPPPPSASNHAATGNPVDFTKVTRSSEEEQITGAMATVGLEEKERDESDMKTAMLLGFDAELAATAGAPGTSALKLHRDDLITEVEEDRYFIVLMAYDFDALWKHKRHKLLWSTRFSVRSRGTNFGEVLPGMVKQASQYFGLNSGGLLHKELPLGRVDVGPVKSLGVVPEK